MKKLKPHNGLEPHVEGPKVKGPKVDSSNFIKGLKVVTQAQAYVIVAHIVDKSTPGQQKALQGHWALRYIGHSEEA